MSAESYYRSIMSCHELEQNLRKKFPKLQIRVLPKNEGLSNATCNEFPERFTLEVHSLIPTSSEVVYCKWCADVCAEEYIQTWGDDDDRQQKLVQLVNTILDEMRRA